ncbi:DpnD/PcfM family protein [Sedimentibacter sp. MB31-C6]|uniref:DpnD/PcfM family protein n=1 Tax=Sedimentibacter sp. MB31-C6 TaxID=3109366 RepID=UPI002DDDACC4|nr:DpnD/PcfM family protein [Sedimentibacter sp. MB36-C1]WSI04776.1 DpnD/PcfM family protein [Sedimentibacter sp. MB36-C1]
MNTYKFEIIETLQKTVDIEATDEKEAYEIISNMYKEEKIVLDSDCFIDFEINLSD